MLRGNINFNWSLKTEKQYTEYFLNDKMCSLKVSMGKLYTNIPRPSLKFQSYKFKYYLENKYKVLNWKYYFYNSSWKQSVW